MFFLTISSYFSSSESTMPGWDAHSYQQVCLEFKRDMEYLCSDNIQREIRSFIRSRTGEGWLNLLGMCNQSVKAPKRFSHCLDSAKVVSSLIRIEHILSLFPKQDTLEISLCAKCFHSTTFVAFLRPDCLGSAKGAIVLKKRQKYFKHLFLYSFTNSIMS